MLSKTKERTTNDAGKSGDSLELVDYRERELSKHACFLWYSLVTYTYDSWHIELNVTNFRIIEDHCSEGVST